MNTATHPPLSLDALARATLTFCIDGADALLYAALKGASSAQEVLDLIIASRPAASERTEALHQLDQVFITGLSRWGRKPTPQALQAFHRALDGWHTRLAQLPCLNWQQLGDWFTMDGTQWIIEPHSAFWPRQLMDLSTRKDWAPPLCLWGIGNAGALTCCDSPVAVVGSRGVNDYGRGVAREVALRAASNGHLVVSGGALGADAAAHWGALSAVQQRGLEASGRTVAVFAGGLNHIGPPSNLRMFEQITAQEGALISEMCPSTIPEPRRFLIRNRIIAALASTVVIAQARLRSGALNTAGWANELGRTVVAAPGDITTPHNAGCNRLISRAEAMLLTSPADIREFCHAPHPPEQRHEHTRDHSSSSTNSHNSSQQHNRSNNVTASQTTSQASNRTPNRTSNQSHNQTHSQIENTSNTNQPNNTTDTLSSSQRQLLKAIRACRRQHTAATPDTLLQYLAGKSTSPTIANIMADLGALETCGVISFNGAATLT